MYVHDYGGRPPFISGFLCSFFPFPSSSSSAHFLLSSFLADEFSFAFHRIRITGRTKQHAPWGESFPLSSLGFSAARRRFEFLSSVLTMLAKRPFSVSRTASSYSFLSLRLLVVFFFPLFPNLARGFYVFGLPDDSPLWQAGLVIGSRLSFF